MYPHEPPKVHCDTQVTYRYEAVDRASEQLAQIYHPNINTEGNVCLNILREDWKPVLDINAVIYGNDANRWHVCAKPISCRPDLSVL